jgi:hypothetical protein
MSKVATYGTAQTTSTPGWACIAIGRFRCQEGR